MTTPRIDHLPTCPDGQPGFRQLHCDCRALERANARIAELAGLWKPIVQDAAKELKLGTMAALLDCPDDMSQTTSGQYRLAHLVVQWDEAVSTLATMREALETAEIALWDTMTKPVQDVQDHVAKAAVAVRAAIGTRRE